MNIESEQNTDELVHEVVVQLGRVRPVERAAGALVARPVPRLVRTRLEIDIFVFY